MGRKKKNTNIESTPIIKSEEVTPEVLDVEEDTRNVTTIGYSGSVKISYKIKGKTVTYKGHNEGLDPMFRFLCMALAGNNSSFANDKPTYLDLKCIYTEESTDSSVTNKVQTKSCLYSPIPLSAPTFQYNNKTKNWETIFDVALSYTMLNRDFINSHTDGTYYFYITSATGTDFARIALDNAQEVIARILPGTQAVIEWTMKIKNTFDA